MGTWFSKTNDTKSHYLAQKVKMILILFLSCEEWIWFSAILQKYNIWGKGRIINVGTLDNCKHEYLPWHSYHQRNSLSLPQLCRQSPNSSPQVSLHSFISFMLFFPLSFTWAYGHTHTYFTMLNLPVIHNILARYYPCPATLAHTCQEAKSRILLSLFLPILLP